MPTRKSILTWLPPGILGAASFALYTATLAPGPVPGDPSEYIFVPAILGIAHPPGYAFYTLVAKAWQTLVAVGSIAYRTNLLAAFAGACVAVLVYGIVWQITTGHEGNEPADRHNHLWRVLAALVAGGSATASVDLWQHAIHANAHILTAALAMACLFLLVRWYRTGQGRWLAASALVAGLSVTQHPILAFSFPAYGVFVLLVQPGLLRQGRKLLGLAVCFLLGLAVFLYYPLRGPSSPFNPLPTPESMLIHVTARGLTVNLFQFGLRDQPTRFAVFWELLRLQYPLVTLALAGLGVAWLAMRERKLLALLGVFYLVNLAFTINTIQDVLAYLMLPFAATAALAGLGLCGVIQFLRQQGAERGWRGRDWTAAAAGIVCLALPVITAAHNLPRVSLHEYTAGDDWVNAVFDQFAGKRQHAVLLAKWEALTPLWVAQYTQGRVLDPADVKLVYIAATSPNPWLEGVFAHWNEGPVYLADFRRGVWEGGQFRLRPEGSWPLWRVVAPGDAQSSPDALTPLNLSAENKVELLGYRLDKTSLRPGETAHLTLSMRAPVTLTQYVMPFALVGDRTYRWTTDSRMPPPWGAGEVIVERYDITIPFGTPPGEMPARLGVTDSSQGRDLALSGMPAEAQAMTTAPIGKLSIEPAEGLVPSQQVLDSALANFGSEMALMGARAGAGTRWARAPWSQPLEIRAGQAIDVWLDWRALKQPATSYKVFVHLIRNDQLAAPAADYYTPLGGAFPTHLWIPVWVEGQAVSDPYRLTIPPGLPPGEYAIEIGVYEQTSELASGRRLPLFDRGGSLAGDRVILGPVLIR